MRYSLLEMVLPSIVLQGLRAPHKSEQGFAGLVDLQDKPLHLIMHAQD